MDRPFVGSPRVIVLKRFETLLREINITMKLRGRRFHVLEEVLSPMQFPMFVRLDEIVPLKHPKEILNTLVELVTVSRSSPTN
jgi:hypothetical protein